MKLNFISNNSLLIKTIFKNLPENHDEYDFIEPFYSNTNFLINKNSNNKIELLNDNNYKLINLLKILRDDEKELIKRIRNNKYSEDVFEKEKNKIDLKDPLELAINELILSIMSVSNNKEKFSNKKNIDDFKNIVEEIKTISKRLQNIFILNENPFNIIEAFNYEKCICLVNTENIDIENNDEYIKIGKILNKYKGKVLINGINCQINRRLYAEWNIVKYNKIEKTKKLKQLWKNF